MPILYVMRMTNVEVMLFQNSLVDLLTSKVSCFITKNIKCCFAKKKDFEGRTHFLRSKDVLLSVMIFNLT